MIRLTTLMALPPLLLGCGSSQGDDQRDPPPDESIEPAFQMQTQPFRVEAGEEVLEVCQSFPVGNDASLWVNSVRMKATPGVHHSDWFVLPEGLYPNSGGAHRCSFSAGNTTEFVDPEKGVFSIFAGAVEGDVLFAQSTQAEHEEQDFGDGIAMEIPPRSQIIVYYHLINTAPEPTDIDVGLDLYTIDESEVVTALKDFSGFNFNVELPPRARSRFSADCMFPDGWAGDFNVHFVLPHYHYYGTGMSFEVLGGPNDGAVLWQGGGGVGAEPISERLDPPASAHGAEGIRFSCDYQNDTDATIQWGVGADDEMCMFLLHTDSDFSLTAPIVPTGSLDSEQISDMGMGPDGVHEWRYEGCAILSPDLL